MVMENSLIDTPRLCTVTKEDTVVQRCDEGDGAFVMSVRRWDSVETPPQARRRNVIYRATRRAATIMSTVRDIARWNVFGILINNWSNRGSILKGQRTNDVSGEMNEGKCFGRAAG
jgi:hypothetical protein